MIKNPSGGRSSFFCTQHGKNKAEALEQLKRLSRSSAAKDSCKLTERRKKRNMQAAPKINDKQEKQYTCFPFCPVALSEPTRSHPLPRSIPIGGN